MPTEKSVNRQRPVVTLRCVEHHLDYTFDGASRSAGVGTPDIQAQTSRNRGTDLILVKHLSLDLARFEDVLGQGLKHGLFTKTGNPKLPCGQSTGPGGGARRRAAWRAQARPSENEANPLARNASAGNSPHHMRGI